MDQLVKLCRYTPVCYAFYFQLKHETCRVNDQVQCEVQVVEFDAFASCQAGEFCYCGE